MNDLYQSVFAFLFDSHEGFRISLPDCGHLDFDYDDFQIGGGPKLTRDE